MRKSLTIGIISIFTALAIVGRIILVILPNVSPVASLSLLAGYIGGPLTGFLVGFLSMFISDLFIGSGPWTPITSFFMGVVGFSGHVFKKFSSDRALLFMLGYLIVLFYDLMTSIILMMPFGVPPLVAILNLFLPISLGIPYPMGPVHELTSSTLFVVFISSLKTYMGEQYGEII